MALTTTEGFCRACGQGRLVTVEMLGVEETAEAACQKATEDCTCPEGLTYREQLRAHRKIQAACGDTAKRAGFEPVSSSAVDFLCMAADAVIAGSLAKVQAECGESVITIKETSSGVKIVRKATLEIGDE